jgi:adenylyltransferase/sulfurtransferase
MSIPEISIHELKRHIDAGESPVILDVRTAREREMLHLGGLLIPLQQLPFRMHELESYRDQTIVVYCRSGARSAQAVRFMHSAGFTGAVNLKGGTQAWREEIDPSMPPH